MLKLKNFESVESLPPQVLENRRVNFPELLKTLNSKSEVESEFKYDRFLGAWLPVQKSYGPYPVRERMFSAEEAINSLRNNGIAILRGLLDSYQVLLLCNEWDLNVDTSYVNEGVEVADRSLLFRSPFATYLNESLAGFFNTVLPEEVKPSYAIASKYKKGSVLARHVDSRPACTWNISIMASGSEPSLVNQWPLFIESHNQRHQVHLAPGDAVIYAGTKSPHWRDAMPWNLDWVLGYVMHYAPFNLEGSLD